MAKREIETHKTAEVVVEAKQAVMAFDQRRLSVQIDGAASVAVDVDRVELGVNDVRLDLPGLKVRITL